MTAQQRKPVTIVTGFLGAGKTTAVNGILKGNHGMRIAVVVNEFGAVGVDGGLIEQTDGNPMIELANGCICCTLKSGLPDTLLGDLLKVRERFDYVVVETTGLANPGPLMQMFMAGTVPKYYSLDGVVTVVDAKSYQTQRAADSVLFDAQVAAARVVLVNKMDLSEATTLGSLEQLIGGQNPLAQIHRTERGRVSVEHLLAPGESDWLASQRDSATKMTCGRGHDHQHCGHDHRHDHGHDHDSTASFQSVSVRVPGLVDWDRFNAWFGGLLFARAHHLFRVKGFLSLPGKDRRLVVESVCEQTDSRWGKPWGEEARTNLLVFIFRKGADITHGTIEDGLTACIQAS